MLHSVQLEKVVLTAVAWNFQLRAQAVGGAEGLREADGRDDVALVVQEGHRPLVQLTRC